MYFLSNRIQFISAQSVFFINLITGQGTAVVNQAAEGYTVTKRTLTIIVDIIDMPPHITNTQK